MKTYSNEKLIKRNHKLANILSIGALLILGLGMYLSFKVNTDTLKLILSYGCLIVGFITFQIGNFFLNRWGKSPRPDEILTAQLKGLDGKYTLYHYMTPISHLLVGPVGVVALLPYSQPGKVKFEEKKKEWKQYGGNWFLKVFGQDSLGRPATEAKYIKHDIERYLSKLGVDPDTVYHEAVLVFTDGKVEIEGEGSPAQFVSAKKLKEFIRKKADQNKANTDSITQLIGIRE